MKNVATFLEFQDSRAFLADLEELDVTQVEDKVRHERDDTNACCSRITVRP